MGIQRALPVGRARKSKHPKSPNPTTLGGPGGAIHWVLGFWMGICHLRHPPRTVRTPTARADDTHGAEGQRGDCPWGLGERQDQRR